MSALGAWQMSWGKLLGGTSYVWYAAGLAFLALVGCYWATGMPPWQGGAGHPAAAPAGDGRSGPGRCHAGQPGPAAPPRHPPAPRRHSQPGRRHLGAAGRRPGSSMAASVALFLPDIAWYGRRLGTASFSRLATLGVFLAWSVFGIYRLMRVELKFQSSPWAWLAFALFLMVYCDGFLYGSIQLAGGALGAWLILPFLLVVRAHLSRAFSRAQGCRSLSLAGRRSGHAGGSVTPGSCCRNGCRSIS